MVSGKGDGFGAEPEMVRPFRQGVGDEHVQTFDPVGHAAAGEISAQIRQCVTFGQIVVVCALVVGAELQVGIEPIGHPVHDVRDLQAGGFRGEPGVGQVVEGGKRRAVGQSG